MKQLPKTFNTVNHDPNSYEFYKVVDQVDFVPTISFLFGLPLPTNNLGKVILDVFGDIDGMFLLIDLFLIN